MPYIPQQLLKAGAVAAEVVAGSTYACHVCLLYLRLPRNAHVVLARTRWWTYACCQSGVSLVSDNAVRNCFGCSIHGTKEGRSIYRLQSVSIFNRKFHFVLSCNCIVAQEIAQEGPLLESSGTKIVQNKSKCPKFDRCDKMFTLLDFGPEIQIC